MQKFFAQNPREIREEIRARNSRKKFAREIRSKKIAREIRAKKIAQEIRAKKSYETFAQKNSREKFAGLPAGGSSLFSPGLPAGGSPLFSREEFAQEVCAKNWPASRPAAHHDLLSAHPRPIPNPIPFHPIPSHPIPSHSAQLQPFYKIAGPKLQSFGK